MENTKFIRLISSFALITLLSLGTAACSNNQSSQKNSTSSSSKSSSKSNIKSNTEKTINKTQTKIKTSQIKVSQEEALDTFNKSYKNSKIKDIDLKIENSKYVYEVEGFDSTKEYNMTIDANNRKVLHKHFEILDLDDRNQSALDLSKTISRNEASKIAENHVSNSTATEWKLEQDHNTAYWEVTVNDGNHTHEIKINAQNKKVIETEQDD